MKKMLMVISVLLLASGLWAQEPAAYDIVKKADDKLRGESSYSEVTMTIVRPTWSRAIGIKGWSRGRTFSMTLITSPAREKGQAFLKRGKDLWNWVPGIERMIKMSSSVMGQSWMGSDFTNDDMVRESSIVNDYTHTLAGSEKVREFDCWKVALIPKENAAVVWGKLIMWISKAGYDQIKTESYDEDDVLINTLNAFDILSFGDRSLPSRMEVVPADKPNQKTVLTVQKYDFSRDIPESFFSQQNMKTLK